MIQDPRLAAAVGERLVGDDGVETRQVAQEQGETFEELLMNLSEAIEGCLAVDVEEIPLSTKDKVIEIAV